MILQNLEGIKILIVINICGPPVLTRQPDGGWKEVSEAPRLLPGYTEILALQLAVGGDIRGGAAVAVRGLCPLYV